MSDTTVTHRLATALLAVVFGLGGVTPVLHVCCTTTGSSVPAHCGTSAPTEHCGEMQDVVVVGYVLHHASQDMRATTGPTVDPSFGSGSSPVARLASARGARTSVSDPSVRRAPRRAVRRHAHVGVWRE